MTTTELAYQYEENGDPKSALSIILDETEKLIALGLTCVAEQYADSIDINKISLCKHAHRFMMLRGKND